MRTKRRLLDEYRFPGFHPGAEIQGIFGDPKARIIHLKRSQKKQFADAVEEFSGIITTRKDVGYGIYPVGIPGSIWRWRCVVFFAGDARR
jgi:hypothetical protein